MKFTVPVNAPQEVAELVAAGADELYCGFLDAWWIERYGNHDSATRRQGAANIATLADLEATVRAARAHGTPIHLALNARYTEAQLDHLVKTCDAFERMGGTGIIASDLGLLWRLRAHSGLARILSILAVAQNTPTLHAFRELGVSRVVLPRFMQPDEARMLLAAVPGMQGEAMAFFDKCPWVDGYCRHRHGVSYPMRDAAADDAGPLYTFDTTYRTHACLRGKTTPANPYPCAACDLPRFEEAGVAYAKLGGRGWPLAERLRALRFLKQAGAIEEPARKATLYRETFGVPCSCYYGDAAQSRHAIACPPTAHTHIGSRLLGSEVDTNALFEALSAMAHGDLEAPASMLVPPLSQTELTQLENALASMDDQTLGGIGFAVNDVGTLVTLAQLRANRELDFALWLGSLLARLDDQAEIAHFLDPASNPPVAVWGPAGEPRTLRYRKPPAPLIEHWTRPSACEPSAQAALAHLTGIASLPYVFS